MPTKPKSVCQSPGCPGYAVQGGYCATHQSSRSSHRRTTAQTYLANNPAQAEAKRFRSSATWRKCEQAHKGCNPMCCNPLKLPNHEEFTEHSHHIIPYVERPDLGLYFENMAPLCSRCHGTIEGMERAGKQTRHLFVGMTIHTHWGDVIVPANLGGAVSEVL